MAGMNRLPWEEIAIVGGGIDPDNYSAATYTTGAIDASLFDEIVFIVQAGDLGASATIDFAVQESSTTTSGDFGAMSPAFAIAQLTQTPANDSNKQVWVRVKTSQLSAGKRYVRGSMVVGSAAVDAGVIALGINPRNGPATDFDLSSVDEFKYA